MYRPFITALWVFLAGAFVVRAQQYTHLSGLIRDPSEAAVPAVSITVVNEETGFRRVTLSHADGGYIVASLLPGVYKITVRKEGFRTVVRLGVKLDVAQPARVDFILPLGSMQETITVEGDGALLHGEDSSVGTLVTHEFIEKLPLNGRGLLSLLELAPGTVVTPATRGEAGQFTTNGQRPNTHYFTVDGVSVNTGVSGGGLPAQVTGGTLPGMTAIGSMHNLISLESLDEFRVQTATTTPEFGRLPGAQVSLSSRSGSNELRGSLFEYFRHERLDANDWFANRVGERRAPLRMNDYGVALGGPLKRNRTFFFLAYEGMRLRQPFAWRSPVPTAEVRETEVIGLRTLLSLFPLPNGGPLGPGLAEWTGRNNRPSGFDSGSMRVDHALTSRITVFGRYSETPSFNEFGNTQISELRVRSRGITGGVNLRARSNLILDVRWNWSRSSAESLWRPANRTTLGPCGVEAIIRYIAIIPGTCDYLLRVSIAGVGQITNGRESDRSQRQWHVLPSAMLTAGTHQLRFGADYRQLNPLRADRSGSFSIIAESLQDLIDKRNLWFVPAKAQTARSEIKEVSAFLQDTWRIHPRLTGTFGLRWEYSPAPNFELPVAGDIPSDELPPAYLFPSQTEIWTPRLTNIAPRLGFAFRPASNGRTVLRGGWGYYYNSSLSIGTDIVNGGPFGVSRFRSGRNGFVQTALYFGFLPGLRLPAVQQWSGTVEHSLNRNNVVSAAYVGSKGHDLLRRELGGPESTEILQLLLATNNGNSNYHALQLQYRGRFAQRFQSILSYAWAHSLDDSSSDSALHLAGADLRVARDRASSDFDIRHSFTAALNYEVPAPHGTRRYAPLLRHWALDSIVRARSGFPITVLNSEHLLGLSFVNAYRPDLEPGVPVWIEDRRSPGGKILNAAAFRVTSKQGNLGRNAISGFGMSQMDLSLRREFSLGDQRALQLRVEAFNLFNQVNFADPIKYLSNPLFGQPSSMLNLMLGTGSPGSGLTPILQTGGPRSLQMVVRFRF
ncbi:MAG TPA: TonB-dependent receptor [Bryobacteraceae bacterium]|nr:TonB-dependent receptor [Bryobacteraceae bacterium]